MTDSVDGCLLLTLPGPQVDPRYADWLAAGVGGVLVMPPNGDPTAFVAAVRRHAPDVVVAVDEEGGDVTRLERVRGSSFPGNLALGTVDDPALTRAVAGAIGDLVAGAGIDLVLAPVADANTDPANPVIGPRSFGADPVLVARHVAAFTAGLQERGVAACAKHFPGHGDTRLDSHTDLPSVDRSAADLARTELVPFRAAVEAGVVAVLTAHVRYPAWDERPATVSRRILTTVLREEVGFTGVVVTDALRMAAIRDGMGAPAAAVAALAAGADLLCVDLPFEEQRAVRTAVVDAVRSGALPTDRVADAAARVRTLRRPRTEPGPVDTGIGLVAARRALAVDPVPLPLPAPPYVIDAGVRTRPGVGVTSPGLLDVLRGLQPRTRGVVVTDPPADPVPLVDAAGSAPLVVAVRDAHRVGWQAELVAAALTRRPDAVIVGTGTDHDRALAAGRYLGTYGCGRANLLAAAEALTSPRRPPAGSPR